MRALPTSELNRDIQLRFQEEHTEEVYTDSDVSESELDDVIGDLSTLIDLSNDRERGIDTAGPSRHNRAALPLHVMFVIDSSASMDQRDVSGKQRLAAVMDACKDFIACRSSDASSTSDVYSMISFNHSAKTWFAGLHCAVALGELGQICSRIAPGGETVFQVAFQEVQKLVASLTTSVTCKHDVRVLLLSDGRPREAFGGAWSGHSSGSNALIALLRNELLRKQPKGRLKQLVIYTVGFGSNAKDFDTYLRPISDYTGGTFHAADLSDVNLSLAFTTVASTITTTRINSDVAPKRVVVERIQLEDSSHQRATTSKKCKLYKVSRLRPEHRTDSGKHYKLQVLCDDASVSIDLPAFDRGGMREVYRMKDTFNKKSGDRSTPALMVGKWLLQRDNATEKEMVAFCMNSETAISFRDQFLKALKDVRILMNIFFVKCYLYEYIADGGNDDGAQQQCYFVGEQCLEGDFVKYNSNNGYVNTDPPHSEAMQAFSHFSFVQSRGKYLVVDLQGVVDKCILLTDPQVLSRDRHKNPIFGPGDLGIEGIRLFFENHICGPTCKALDLKQKADDMLNSLRLESRRCIICYDAPSKTMIKPCGHSLVCRKCAEKLQSMGKPCPACKGRIDGFDNGIYSATYVRPEKRRVNAQDRQANITSSFARVQQGDASTMDLATRLRESVPSNHGRNQGYRGPPLGGARQIGSRVGGRFADSFRPTRLCAYYQQRGGCINGRSCPFAHGARELLN